MIAGLRLLISIEETEEPFKRTWTEANETCRRLGTNLPSFVSQEDVKNFFVFLEYFDLFNNSDANFYWNSQKGN